MKDLIETKSGFDLAPRSIDDAMNLARMIAGSQLAPKSFAGKPEDTLVAMMMGNEIGLNPMQAIQNIAVINGRPSIWGDAMLALVQNHPAFKSIDESFDKSTMTATCTVTRKGGNPHTQTFSQEDATKAGLWGKQGPWQTNPKRMLSMRARGFALRNQFADALLGLISAEEAQDYQEEHSYTVISEPDKKELPGLPEYTEEMFEENKGMYQGIIESGKGSPESLINKLSTKYSVPESIKSEINKWGEK